jgi:CRP-like cAMP-binding protein
MDAASQMTTVEKAALLIEVDLFQEVPSDALAELAASMEDTWHEAGEILLEPGAPDARLSVIVDGHVQVRRGEDIVGNLARGSAFGLLAALGLEHRETVTAETPCRVLSIAPDEYLDALADSTAFAIANLRALGRRLQVCETRVSGSARERSAGGDTR